MRELYSEGPVAWGRFYLPIITCPQFKINIPGTPESLYEKWEREGYGYQKEGTRNGSLYISSDLQLEASSI